jgi:ketosteroid isomerase-like protein
MTEDLVVVEKKGMTICARHKVKRRINKDRQERQGKNKSQEEAREQEGGCLFLNGVVSPKL